MKGTGLRVTAVLVFLFTFAATNVASFLLGRASVEYTTVSWEEAQVFYAVVLKSPEEGTLLVEGLPVNDVNGRGKFALSLEEEPPLLWRGEEIPLESLEPGHTVAVTYTGPVAESEPAGISQVLRLTLLEDTL